MWQQDVLRYLTDRGRTSGTHGADLDLGLHIPQEAVRTELDLSGDDFRLDNFVNRRTYAAYSKPISAADVVDKLVSPRVQSGEIDTDRELQNFREFLRAEEIRDAWTDYTDYEQVLTTAFTEALRSHHPYDAPPRIQNTSLAPFHRLSDAKRSLRRWAVCWKKTALSSCPA